MTRRPSPKYARTHHPEGTAVTAADADAIVRTATGAAPAHEVSEAVNALHGLIRKVAGDGNRSVAFRDLQPFAPGVLRAALLVLVENGFAVNTNGRGETQVSW